MMMYIIYIIARLIFTNTWATFGGWLILERFFEKD